MLREALEAACRHYDPQKIVIGNGFKTFEAICLTFDSHARGLFARNLKSFSDVKCPAPRRHPFQPSDEPYHFFQPRHRSKLVARFFVDLNIRTLD